MDSLGRLLPKILARQPGSRPVLEARVRIALAELLGPGLGSQLATVEIRGSKLSVATPNAFRWWVVSGVGIGDRPAHEEEHHVE